jgi:hypothetical protein
MQTSKEGYIALHSLRNPETQANCRHSLAPSPTDPVDCSLVFSQTNESTDETVCLVNSVYIVKIHYSLDHSAEDLSETQYEEIAAISHAICRAAMTMWGEMSDGEGRDRANEVLKDLFAKWPVFGSGFARRALNKGWGIRWRDRSEDSM